MAVAVGIATDWAVDHCMKWMHSKLRGMELLGIVYPYNLQCMYMYSFTHNLNGNGICLFYEQLYRLHLIPQVLCFRRCREGLRG